MPGKKTTGSKQDRSNPSRSNPVWGERLRVNAVDGKLPRTDRRRIALGPAVGSLIVRQTALSSVEGRRPLQSDRQTAVQVRAVAVVGGRISNQQRLHVLGISEYG